MSAVMAFDVDGADRMTQRKQRIAEVEIMSSSTVFIMVLLVKVRCDRRHLEL